MFQRVTVTQRALNHNSVTLMDSVIVRELFRANSATSVQATCSTSAKDASVSNLRFFKTDIKDFEKRLSDNGPF